MSTEKKISAVAGALDMPVSVTLNAKWGKERIELSGLHPSATIAQVKDLLSERTSVLPKRQKLIGLTTTNKRKVTDDVLLSELKVKGGAGSSNGIGKSKKEGDGNEIIIRHNFILMGTPEEKIFVDPQQLEFLPDVVDDFDLDFNAGSDEWLEHVAKGENLRKFTESTMVHIMNDPRPSKPLMVLDLDHTLLDFSRKSIQQASNNDRANGNDGGDGNNGLTAVEAIERMKRPYMDEFLAKAYQSYDLVVWSQTSWRWLETKLIELGMLANPRYKFCFVLDKTSMFAITSTKKDGTKVKHSVKPLQIIWNKFPNQWGPHNTVHLDDLSRNFALNLQNGLKVTAYYRKKTKGKRDVELVGLSNYLTRLANEVSDFTKVKFSNWMEVLAGKPLIEDDQKKEAKK